MNFNAKTQRRDGARIGEIFLCCVLASLRFCVDSSAATNASIAPAGMVQIPAGVYRPLLKSKTDAAEIAVKSFYLDVEPVSNGEFLEFVRAHPQWQRSNVARLFADKSYLKNWAGDLEPGKNAPSNAPVTFVSWFAAKAYAQWKHERLPTIAEWELAANASATRADGENDPQFKAEILKWYCESSATEFLPVGVGGKNFYGVRDLHGLVWEWTADFNSAILSGDSRDDGADAKLFCGAGAQSARAVDDYPAFMRFAFRSSLKADYCIHNLGFRCAKDL
ncbi:MAG TPA: formylglycine-generating enzyme family protein [Verrucomicrobiae bacterium]|nr:formylglycine-generating enzyme family protein [Verrucomicrobiae bacterium]